MTTCPHEHEDGAYVLGALSPEERLAFERHLPGCDSCARSVRHLAGIPGLLARVPVEILDPEQPPVPVPETLLPALVREARRSQRRRMWITGGLVAAAAAVAIGAVGVSTLGDDGSHSSVPTAAPTARAQQLHPLVADAPISGWVSLTQVGWGTRLDLTCAYTPEDGDWKDHAPPMYTMYVTRTDGTVEQVASWKGLPGKSLHIVGATSADTADIEDVEVRLADGRPVLDLDG
jgi:hypothetical protein